MLDAIFAESFGRWGGRFSLIVPCDNDAIRPAYLAWLMAHDADILYSYVDFSDAAVERLHEVFGPAFLVRHDFYGSEKRDHHAFRPKLPITPLTVLSVTPLMTRGNMLSPPSPVALVDTHIGAEPPRFLQENFGCYGQSLSPWPIARDMRDFLKPVIFVPEHIRTNPKLVPRAEGEQVPSEGDLLALIAQQRDLVGLGQLSAVLTPRIELRDMAWSRTVNLVVGDSFADRLIFWNGLHHTPVWVSGNITTLKVSEDDLHDVDRFNAIIDIVKNRISLPLGGSASYTQIVVRSSSVAQSELDGIAARLRARNPFNLYTSEHVISVDAVVPSESALASRQYIEVGSPFQSRDLNEITFSETSFRAPVVLPRHLRETPQLPLSAKQGLWQLDLVIERLVDHSWVRNAQRHWRLPRRLRMVGAFTRGFQFASMSPRCMPRATWDGLLSLSCEMDRTLPEISVPTDETAFRYAICAQRDWWPFVHNQAKPRPGLALDMRPSDKGRYLTALLRMSGGIHQAKEIFLSQFWKEQFEQLGAKQSQPSSVSRR
jgi:hypothetical protein